MNFGLRKISVLVLSIDLALPCASWAQNAPVSEARHVCSDDIKVLVPVIALPQIVEISSTALSEQCWQKTRVALRKAYAKTGDIRAYNGLEFLVEYEMKKGLEGYRSGDATEASGLWSMALADNKLHDSRDEKVPLSIPNDGLLAFASKKWTDGFAYFAKVYENNDELNDVSLIDSGYYRALTVALEDARVGNLDLAIQKADECLKINALGSDASFLKGAFEEAAGHDDKAVLAWSSSIDETSVFKDKTPHYQTNYSILATYLLLSWSRH